MNNELHNALMMHHSNSSTSRTLELDNLRIYWAEICKVFIPDNVGGTSGATLAALMVTYQTIATQLLTQEQVQQFLALVNAAVANLKTKTARSPMNERLLNALHNCPTEPGALPYPWEDSEEEDGDPHPDDQERA